jgi:ribosomal protein L23
MPLGRNPTKREKRKLKKAVKKIVRSEKKAVKILNAQGEETEPRRKSGGRKRKAIKASMHALANPKTTGKTVG